MSTAVMGETSEAVEVIYDPVCLNSGDEAADEGNADDVTVRIQFDLESNTSGSDTNSAALTTNAERHDACVDSAEHANNVNDDDDDNSGYESYANVAAYLEKSQAAQAERSTDTDSEAALAGDPIDISLGDDVIEPPESFSNERCNNYSPAVNSGDIHSQIENCLRNKPQFVQAMMTSQREFEHRRTVHDECLTTTTTAGEAKKSKGKSKNKTNKAREKTLTKRYSLDDFNLSAHDDSTREFTTSKSDYNFNKLKRQLKRPFSTVFLPAISRKYNSISILFQR